MYLIMQRVLPSPSMEDWAAFVRALVRLLPGRSKHWHLLVDERRDGLVPLSSTRKRSLGGGKPLSRIAMETQKSKPTDMSWKQATGGWQEAALHCKATMLKEQSTPSSAGLQVLCMHTHQPQQKWLHGYRNVWVWKSLQCGGNDQREGTLRAWLASTPFWKLELERGNIYQWKGNFY